MTLKTKPRNTAVPFVLDVYDADLPEGSPRVVARCDTRDGTVYRTARPSGLPLVPLMPMAAIRAAVAEARS